MRAPVFILEMMLLLPLCMARPFIGIMIFSWVSFMNPHQQLWGVAFDLPWAQMVFAATVIGCFVAGEPKRFPLNTTTGLLAVLMLMFCLTTLTAAGPWNLVSAKFFLVSKVFIVVLLTATLLTDKYRIHALVWVMAISLGYYGLRGGAFEIVHAGSDRVYGPPNSMISDNNHIAAALLVCLPLINYLRLQSPEKWIRAGLFVTMGVTLFAVVGSYSRGALVGLVSVAGFSWLKSRNKLVYAFVLLPVMVGVLTFMPEAWMHRMMTIGSYEQDASAGERLAMWRVAWQLGLARPLTGAGFEGPYIGSVVQQLIGGGNARAVHSIYLEVIGEHGFFVFGIWLAISISGLVNTSWIVRNGKKFPELQWAVDLGRMTQISIIAYLTAGAFLSLSYWDYYFTIIVIIAMTRVQVEQVVRARVPQTWADRRMMGGAVALPRQSG